MKVCSIFHPIPTQISYKGEDVQTITNKKKEIQDDLEDETDQIQI